MRLPFLVMCLVVCVPSHAQSLTIAAAPHGIPVSGTVALGGQSHINQLHPNQNYPSQDLPRNPYLPPGYPSTGYPSTGYPSYDVPLPGHNPLGSLDAIKARQPEDASPSLLDGAIASPAPTAADQGASFIDHEAEALRMADEMARHTDRQAGRQVVPPGPANVVAADHSLSRWLHAWEGLLLNAGVSGSKVRFEAGRLDSVEFAHWASRQLQASSSAHIARGAAQ